MGQTGSKSHTVKHLSMIENRFIIRKVRIVQSEHAVRTLDKASVAPARLSSCVSASSRHHLLPVEVRHIRAEERHRGLCLSCPMCQPVTRHSKRSATSSWPR